MKKRTIYQMVIDRSGSMQGMENQVISGFNEQLQSMQNIQDRYPEQEILMSLRFFNEQVGVNILEHNPVKACNLMGRHEYRTSGGTALLDAVGKSIYDIKMKFGDAIAHEDTTVVMIIITDGYENSSRIYTYEEISRMIGELEATENWTFTFMGADLDAIAASSRMGIGRNHTFSFDKADYRNVSKDILSEAAMDYAEKRQRNVKVTEFLNKFGDKDQRKNK